MRVAVLGAGGTIAPAIVRDLAESEEVTALRLLDLDLRRAEEVAIEHGLGKAQAHEADATSNLSERLAGIDVLVISAAYRINLAAMSACLEAGCHYMDLGGLYHVTREQLALSSKFKTQGLLALLGIGSAPGKTNLLAARAAAQLPGDPVSISVAAAGRDLAPPSGLSFPYAVRTLLDELTLPPRGASGRSGALCIAPVGPHGLGSPGRGDRGGHHRERAERHRAGRALGDRRRRLLDGDAGSGRRAPPRPGPDHCGRGAAARALHRPR